MPRGRMRVASYYYECCCSSIKRDIKSSKGGRGGDIRLVVSQKEGESIISLAFNYTTNIAQCPIASKESTRWPTSLQGYAKSVLKT